MVFNPKLEDIVITDIIALDTEFNTLDTLNADCLVISISNSDKVTYVLDVQKYEVTALTKLFEVVGKCSLLICHNVKVDIGVVWSNFGVLLKNGWCTMLASLIIDNGYSETKNMVGGIPNLEKPHSLRSCLIRFLGLNMSTAEEKKGLQESFINLKFGSEIFQAQLEYAGKDTAYLIDLHNAQLIHIKDRNLGAIIKLENTLTPVLVRMEHKGCLIDQAKHKDNIKKWKRELIEVVAKMDECICDLSKSYDSIRGGKYTNKRVKAVFQQLDAFGAPPVEIENENKHNINYSSSTQINDIFTRLQLPKPVDDAGKVGFGEEPLNMYLTNHPHTPLKQFLNHLLKYRELSKLIETYGPKFLQALDQNGRLRTNYQQTFTDTGRLTSSEVIKKRLGANLANIPKNKDMRSIFIPDPGYSFIDSDMTGQELILAGDFSHEPVLIKAFQEGFDHHSFLASISYSLIFNQTVEIKNQSEMIMVDGYEYNVKKLRDDHKAALFSLIYLGGKKRIMNILNEYMVNHVEPESRESVAQLIVQALHKALPKLISFLKGAVEQTKKDGYVVANKLGRRRYFDYPDDVYGDAANLKIQGTGADSIKIALINIDKWIDERSQELGIPRDEFGWITMTIYDQNLICINDKYLEEAKRIPEIMGESISWFLTILKGSSDFNIRKYWSK